MLPTSPLLNATAPAGPHLPVALLRQYAAGALAPAAQHRVEAHTLACPRCADTLAGLQQTLPATTDHALAQLQQRLRQRVQQQAAPARHDREERRNRWLLPQLAAAAALLLGLVAGGWWAWQQRRLAAPAVTTAAITNAPLAAPALPAPASGAVAAPAAIARMAHAPTTRKPVVARATRRRASAPPALVARAAAVETVANALVATANQIVDGAAAPVARAPVPPPTADSAGPLAGRVAGITLDTKRAENPFEGTPLRLAAMPAAPKLPPAPVGGYATLRDKLRREAAEYVPEAPERRLSGTVQLRLTVGADGKIQQTKVVRGLRADYDAEAQRLVCDGPNWVPGISSGKRAPLDIDIAVPF
ncbi:MAG: hypothetical protein EOO56_08540 [Hymenobacter sp.]|nr:MAG: hypothetical protein EOO56_08540 [Hymenobacter sp.]